MAKNQLVSLDFNSVAKIINLPDATNPQEPVTLAQLRAAIEGLAWKDNAKVRAGTNITIATPGASIDGVAMGVNDRVLLPAQASQPDNGIYIWNGAAVPMTRSLDASTFDELESAVITIDEGTSAGVTYRQTQVNGVLGINNVAWTTFGTAAGAATETSAGVAEIATQAETDAGLDDARFVTSLKLATSVFASKKFNANIGDGSSTSLTVTHNLGSKDVHVQVYRNSGNFDEVGVEVRRTTINAVAVLFDAAPAANAFRAVVKL